MLLLLLASGAIKVLSCLIHNLVGWRAAHGQVHMLSRSTPSGPGPALRRVVPIPFDTLNQLPCLWIHFGERVDRVVLGPTVISRDAPVRNVVLDKGSVACAPLGRTRYVVQVDLAPAAVLIRVASIVQDGWRLLEASVDC